MLCVKCQKRPAVVFVQRLENGKTVQEGYCLTCARAMHIQPVDDLMKQFGMSDQDLENMEERMSSFLQEASDSGMLAPMMNGDDTDAGDEPAPQDDFVPGGSPVFPFGFGARQNKNDTKPKNGKKEKAPRRKFLETYCENLTQKARDGKTDRIIGRDREIYRTIQILCRRQKNNPCLIGEAGVGKTAIAEGIAQRIAEQQQVELVDVELVKEPAGHFLRFYIEKPDGVSLNELETFHRQIQPLVEDVAYDYMEVSSPGADRPLKTARDFERAAGMEVELKTYRPVNGAKRFQGELLGLEDGVVKIIAENGAEMAFPQKDVAIVRPLIEFTEADLADDIPAE